MATKKKKLSADTVFNLHQLKKIINRPTTMAFVTLLSCSTTEVVQHVLEFGFHYQNSTADSPVDY